MAAKKTAIKLGGQTFNVSPMNFGQLEQALPIISAMRGGTINDQIASLLDVMQIVLSADYPDVVVRSLPADLDGLKVAFTQSMTSSGYVMAGPGDAPAGEASARAKSTSRKRAAA